MIENIVYYLEGKADLFGIACGIGIFEAVLGNTCGRKPTSCADQLARAVRQAREELRES